MFRAVARVLVLATAACATPRGGGYRVPTPPSQKTPGVSIIAANEVDGLTSEPWSLPFGANTDGTSLLVRALSQVDERAEFVSGIRIHVVHQGRDCATAIGPDRDVLATVAAPVAEPLEEREVTRMVQVCQSRRLGIPITNTIRTEPSRPVGTATDKYRASLHSERVEYSTHWINSQQCGWAPRRFLETHYAFQAATGYVPPQLDPIALYYSRWHLIESAPHCVPADVGAASRVELTLHRRADAVAPPPRAPA